MIYTSLFLYPEVCFGSIDNSKDESTFERILQFDVVSSELNVPHKQEETLLHPAQKTLAL